nr:MAG TPA: Repressor protein CI [Bacteriophage sp.]DAO70830.1 MAG TPA: Repressor protein CI [Bacteriophage sp.]
MNERIKSLRKSLSMTQEEFSKQIGLSRNFIAQVEIGTKTPSDRTISDICREFNVNEEWLRTGEGEMFIQKSKEEQLGEMLAEITKADDESFKKRLIVALANLDENGWDSLEKLIDSISKK